MSQGKQRWPDKRYDREVEWKEGVLPERSELFSSTRSVSPEICDTRTPANSMTAFSTFQGSFVSLMRAALYARVSTHDQHTLTM